MLWILAILVAAIVAFIIFIVVLSVKAILFVIGIVLVVLAIAVVVVPVAALAVAFGRDFRAPASSRRTARLILTALAAVALIAVDLVWIFHRLHWADAPLLAFVLIGVATGGLALLQEPVPVWVETPRPPAAT